MAFIGNTNTTQAFTPAIDYFSGNGSTTAFTLSRPVASVAQVQVVIDNVAQNPSSAFTVSANTITFTSAPLSGTNNIYVYYTSPITQVIAPGQSTVGLTAFTATGTPSASTYLRGDNSWATISAASLTTPSFTSTIGVGAATAAASGAGITFPATQSASSNANTLDDYERGTWTPTIIPGIGTVVTQTCSGSYVKIGKLVYVTFSIKPDTGTISEIDHIDGLPYATDNINPAGFGTARSNATGSMWFTRTISSDSSIYLAQYNNTSLLSAGQTLIGAIAYIAAT